MAVIPVDRRLSAKKMASALGGQRCYLSSPRDAERVTGDVTGGISPFGQHRRLKLVLDASAAGFETIAVSGGRRGCPLEVTPRVVVAVSGGAMAAIAED